MRLGVKTMVVCAVLALAVFTVLQSYLGLSGGGILPRVVTSWLYGGKVDPDLQDISYPAVVLLAVEASRLKMLDKYRILKVWRFGDLAVVKYRALSFQEIVDLAQRDVIISAMALNVKPTFPDPVRKMLQMLVEGYLEQELSLALAYPRDAKLDLHHVTFMYTGRNVTVCIVDSGIDYLHPDLRHAVYVLVSTVVKGNGHPLVWIRGVNRTVMFDGRVYNISTLEGLYELDKALYEKFGEYAFMDLNGHGTHCSGILVGSGKVSNGKYMGFVPAARLVMIKAFYRDGSASIDSIMDALEWIYENAEKFNIDLCSFSWGIAKASDGSDPVSLAVSKIVHDRDVVIIVAAGNNFAVPYTINIPAVCHGCVAVGALDPYTYNLAPFSSAGPTPDGRVKPDFVGAGVLVVSTVPVTVRSEYEKLLEEHGLKMLMVGDYYTMMSGTSMATPCVAGIFAKAIEYLKARGEKPTPEKALNIVLKWTKRINPITKDIYTGWGLPQEP